MKHLEALATIAGIIGIAAEIWDARERRRMEREHKVKDDRIEELERRLAELERKSAGRKARKR